MSWSEMSQPSCHDSHLQPTCTAAEVYQAWCVCMMRKGFWKGRLPVYRQHMQISLALKPPDVPHCLLDCLGSTRCGNKAKRLVMHEPHLRIGSQVKRRMPPAWAGCWRQQGRVQERAAPHRPPVPRRPAERPVRSPAGGLHAALLPAVQPPHSRLPP